MQTKILICLPANVFVEHFNAAERARFARLQADLMLRRSRGDTVVLKNLATVAYNGRMGTVVGVQGARTVVVLVPDGEMRSFPTANTSVCRNGLCIVCLNECGSLRENYRGGDLVVWFDTHAILQQASAAPSAAAGGPTVQLWASGPHLPTEKVTAFWGSHLELHFPAPFRNRSATEMVNMPHGPVTMTTEHATETQLNSFCTLVQDIRESSGVDTP